MYLFKHLTIFIRCDVIRLQSIARNLHHLADAVFFSTKCREQSPM